MKIHNNATVDTVGNAAIEKSSLPFRWWVDVNYLNGKYHAVVHYHTGRGQDPKHPSSEGGELRFFFNEREVFQVVPSRLAWDKFGIVNAFGAADWQSGEINEELHEMLKDISCRYREASRADSAMLEAFSQKTTNGLLKPGDDPFVARLRTLALHQSVMKAAKRCKSFKEWTDKLKELGFEPPEPGSLGELP